MTEEKYYPKPDFVPRFQIRTDGLEKPGGYTSQLESLLSAIAQLEPQVSCVHSAMFEPCTVAPPPFKKVQEINELKSQLFEIEFDIFNQVVSRALLSESTQELAADRVSIVFDHLTNTKGCDPEKMNTMLGKNYLNFLENTITSAQVIGQKSPKGKAMLKRLEHHLDVTNEFFINVTEEFAALNINKDSEN